MKFGRTLAIAIMISIIGYGTTFADTTMNGQATLTVTPPTDNALSLTKVPSLDFGNVTIGTTGSAISGSANQPYTIIDLRGGDAGYRIQVEISNFTLLSNPTKILPVTSVAMKVTNNSNGQLTGNNSDVNILGQKAVMVTGGVDSNGTQTSGDVSAKLTIDSQKMGSLKKGQYQATITHSIVSGIQ